MSLWDTIKLQFPPPYVPPSGVGGLSGVKSTTYLKGEQYVRQSKVKRLPPRVDGQRYDVSASLRGGREFDGTIQPHGKQAAVETADMLQAVTDAIKEQGLQPGEKLSIEITHISEV